MSNGRRGAGAASASSAGNARGASGEAPANVWARLMRKQLSPVEVARAAFERIAAWENKIKSLDEVGARAQGVLSEARWHAGEALSPLDGVPITIKGNIAVKGIPTPVGTAA